MVLAGGTLMQSRDDGIKTGLIDHGGEPSRPRAGQDVAIYLVWISIILLAAWRVWANKKTRRPREVDAGSQ
jgi:hypothetical protein